MVGENRMRGKESRLLPNTSNHISYYTVLFTKKKHTHTHIQSKFSLSLITLISFLVQDCRNWCRYYIPACEVVSITNFKTCGIKCICLLTIFHYISTFILTTQII